MTEDSSDQLQPEHFLRADESDDGIFYEQPRLVTHIDDPACAALNDYFREHLPAGGDILDLMSSCVSHLPWDVEYKSVTGVGMNQVELDDNKQLTERLVHNLSNNPTPPIADNSFDGCMITVSVQYLIHPVHVFGEIARVLRSGSRCIVSFSNRCFPTKAIALWHQMDDIGHAKLVGYYFNESGGFEAPQFENISPNPGETDPLYVVTAVTKAD
jgi:SAM-dependent methyltransferase